MTKAEVSSFVKKIKAYYNYFNIEDEEIFNEWVNKLRPYETEDVEKKLEEHLVGEKADEVPKLHFITRYLKTKEEKERYKGEYLVRCNLCGREMYYSEYERHYGKCLDIEYLVSIAKQKGEYYTREDIEDCKQEVIDKLLAKYPPNKIRSLDEIWKTQ